ncbi:MAG: Ig-like domain-containing protein, partial [Xanthomonadales bacterium]|nr:Ig-like domain-containing protein [Xanthomonadales bacterium]
MRAFLAVIALSLIPFAPLKAAVFINEIHYDDSTMPSDVGEAIEVVATAGENLADFDLVLYNGNGGGTVYDTDAVTVGSSVTCGGTVSVGVVNYPSNGIQNGNPDGIALVLRSTSSVIQFLSYEGTFTAVGGPADGMLSTDIGVFELNTTTPGTSLQLSGGPGSAYADFSWQGSSAQTFGACNNGQTFGPGVDNPPAVASTTPPDLATDVLPTVILQVQFNEPVTVSNGWFDLQCSLSGSVTVTESGGPASYMLDPLADLQFGESCTATIDAMLVVDQDGTPDNMVGDYSFSFTVANDDPPTVQGTVPADSSSSVSVASNVTIEFSEPVMVNGSWFDISCANSLAHSAVVSGGPTIYVLDPAVNFDNLELCTVVIGAAQVVDLDGTPDPMLADYSFSFTTTVGVSDYYASVNPSTPASLRATLHETIDDHTRFPYSAGTTDTWDILELADEDPNNSGQILDVYKNAVYPKAGGGNANYNREHTWPNSRGFGDNNDGAPPDQQNYPYTDTHMLYLSDISYNSDRGSLSYDNCAGCTERPTNVNNGQGGGTGVYPGNSNWFSGVFEVWNA